MGMFGAVEKRTFLNILIEAINNCLCFKLKTEQLNNKSPTSFLKVLFQKSCLNLIPKWKLLYFTSQEIERYYQLFLEVVIQEIDMDCHHSQIFERKWNVPEVRISKSDTSQIVTRSEHTQIRFPKVSQKLSS